MLYNLHIFFFLFSFTYLAIPRDRKNYFRGSFMEKKFGNADLECGVYRLMYQVKEIYLYPLCRLPCLVT